MDLKASIAVALLCTVGCAVSAVFFLIAYRRKEFRRGLWLKTLTSLFFVAVGIVMMVNSNSKCTALQVVCGLALGLIGDVLLALRQLYKARREFFFTVGALAFAVGHVMYMLALRSIAVVHWGAILAVFVLGMLLSHCYALYRKIDVGSKKLPAMIYLAIVVLMGSVAICTGIAVRSPAAILFAVGGLLFAISDNILCAYSYGNKSIWRMNRILHIAYYGAQLAIAWSILFI